MSRTILFDEYTSVIRDRAAAANGQTVAVNLVGGQTLTGTHAYASAAATYPAGGIDWPTVLTVTVSTKAHTVRLDHVSSIGQG
ncbi:hypothetical protein BN159_8239 [Streptomyces davaonensis JCM 4913]|uniref:Uncharacterized protein n=1 Tax=Streptomyces davaonensis (strain DSM 101723 / JCM 4913 / KCC S-0913 / 768) TaxID=1214101 RepID=K4RFZ0_STRDJ|nr:hypothetical protein [Streptomyces davaonensis]CCK32617.1 hypothetical protein BN159_8239 [Streptomyces davaonensis JCM 4913]